MLPMTRWNFPLGIEEKDLARGRIRDVDLSSASTATHWGETNPSTSLKRGDEFVFVLGEIEDVDAAAPGSVTMMRSWESVTTL